MSENFADLLAESFAEDTSIEGSVVKGIVVGLSDDYVTIDVGLKSEGRVPKKNLLPWPGCRNSAWRSG